MMFIILAHGILKIIASKYKFPTWH